MKLKELRRYAKKSLSGYGIPDADSAKLELLFEYAFNFSRNFILSEPDFEIAEDEKLAMFKEALASVCSGAPVQYAVGFSYFCGLKFKVGPEVLIPRLETELLVDIGEKLVSSLAAVLKRPVRVLDLCSGSGAIGIALKKRCPGCDVTLSDVSPGAIAMSKRNAEAILGSSGELNYVLGSFLDPFTEAEGILFDVILSNPPYVATEVMKTLPLNVRDYEPRLALDGGAGGLVPYEKIAKKLASVCKGFGLAVFEIGEDQGQAVTAILRAKGFGRSQVIKDLDGKDRFVAAARTGVVISESDPEFAAHKAALYAFKGLSDFGGISGRLFPENARKTSESAKTAVPTLPVASDAKKTVKFEEKAAVPDTSPSDISPDAASPKVSEKKPSSAEKDASDDSSEISLLSPVSAIKGVGPKTEAAFRKLGINNISDLLSFYPSGYENRKLISDVDELSRTMQPGEYRSATLVLKVGSLAERGNPSNPVFVYSCSDRSGSVDVVFFNNKYVKSLIRPGRTYYFYGKLRKSPDFFGALSMQQPRFADAANAKAVSDFLVLSPVYRTGGKLGAKEVSNAVKGALLLCGEDLPGSGGNVPDLPSVILERYGLPRGRGLLRSVHFPETLEEAANAQRRIEFEKLLVIALNIQALKTARNSGLKGISYPGCDLSGFTAKLPFTLTGGQTSVIDTIMADMNSPRPMNRLVNGDVGSGKTVVALAAIYNAVSNGFQAALMVPSTVLASQHMSKISAILGSLGIDSEMLYSSTGRSDRKRILKRIENGDPICLIGTHSLIGEEVNYKKLGLVVIDEQHRFGVLQRASLIAKSGGAVPDVLSLTATPIPRSLALVLYGDMDISVLSEKPAGRIPVGTYLYGSGDRPAIYRRCLDLVKNGGQAYIVHAKIDKNDNDEAPSGAGDELIGCVENYERASAGIFSGIPTGIIHGKMSDREKQAAMEAFAKGETKVLFATTVIEVGVDVPSATLMIIEDAERFGLSTLHQLRGRVGRGGNKSYCVLISDKSSERLSIMTETNDGFKIAEKDLELRGPGDFFGTAQTGAGDEAILAASASPKLLEAVRYSAEHILAHAGDPDTGCGQYLNAVTEKARQITL